ncbi:DNA primase [Candidatus Marinimicrobia bacterium]|nr:DNA primase [Candidatus Neomarinimicrobiota bacterium]MDC0521135.1 DNA primase [Candidatus Neomarinimicrobiota bacterium]MDC1145881.1 DNA primase [Candidatus Neomarinimicrobiota bacterium]
MRRIAQETINRVLEEVDVLDVISQYVDLKKRGQNYFGLSPFRSETKPSFSVAPEKNMWYDFGSAQGGNAVQFLIEYEKISFPEAIRSLAEKYGIEIIELGNKEQNNLYDQLYEIHELACIYFENNIKDKPEGKAKKYLTDRAFHDDIINKFRIGFAPDSWDSLLKELEGKFDNQILKKSGLFSESKKGPLIDRFRNRIMFPFFSLSGKIIGFSGRSLSEKEDVKYLNSPETLLFEKSKIFFGSYQTQPNIRKKNFAILVEGQTDFLRLVEQSFDNVLATSGTAFSSKHAVALKKYTNRVILCYDSDSAGINAAIRTSYVLLQNGIETRVLYLGNGDDPDDFFKKDSNTKETFRSLIKTAAHPISFIIKHKDILSQGAADQSKFLNECIGEIQLVPDSMVRNDLIRKLSNELGVVEAEVLDRFSSLKQKRYKAPVEGDSSTTEVTHYRSSEDKAQLELIKLALHSPELAPTMPIALFSNKLLYNVLKVLIDNSDKGYKPGQILELIGGSPEQRNLIASLAIEVPDKEYEQTILDDCIATLKRNPVKKEIAILRDKIRRMEEEDTSPDKALLEELSALQKKLQ